MKIGLEKGAARSRQQRETNRLRVLDAVQAAGAAGVTTTQLRNTLRLGESSVGAHLRDLQAGGLVAKHPRTGCLSRWYLHGIQPDAPPRLKRRRDRERERVSQWVELWVSTPIVRKVIPAADAPPMLTKARGLWDV